MLERKRNSFVVSAYADTRICANFEEFFTTMRPHERPHAFIIGSPPACRGSNRQGKDIELKILEAFPDKTPAVSRVDFPAPCSHDTAIHREAHLDGHGRERADRQPRADR